MRGDRQHLKSFWILANGTPSGSFFSDDLEIDAAFQDAFNAAQAMGQMANSERILKLARLISARKLGDLILDDRNGAFRENLLAFLQWVKSALEVVSNGETLNRYGLSIHSPNELQGSLENAIFVLQEILGRFGKGGFSQELRHGIWSTARSIRTAVRSVIRFISGGFAKHGLPCVKLCLNVFCQFLVPQPRGQISYVTP